MWLRRFHTRGMGTPDWVNEPARSLDMPLLQLSQRDALTFRDALGGGIALLGSPGSGKTAIMEILALAAMRAGCSVVCFSVKPDSALRCAEIAKLAGRTDVTIFNPLSTPFNPLAEMQARGKGSYGLHGSLLAMTMDTLKRLHEGSSGDAKFWAELATIVASHLLLIGLLADVPLSFAWLADCVRTLPRSPAEAADPVWRKTCPACAALETALRRPLTPAQRIDLDKAARWLLDEVTRQPDKTRASIEATLMAGLESLTRSELGHAINRTDTHWSPAFVSDRPSILICDCAVDEIGPLGAAIQRLLKATLLHVLQRRKTDATPHPVLLFLDEWQELVDHRTDPLVMRSLRDRRAALVSACQSVPTLVTACEESRQPEQSAMSLLGMAGAKIFCASTCVQTLKYAEQVMSSTPHTTVSFGTSEREDGGKDGRKSPGKSANFSTEIRPDTPAYLVQRLRTGGPANKFCVEAFVTIGGRVFRASSKTSLKVAFRQLQLPPCIPFCFLPESRRATATFPSLQGDRHV